MVLVCKYRGSSLSSASPHPHTHPQPTASAQTRPQPQTQTPMQVAEGKVGPPPDKGVSILGRPIVRQLPSLLLLLPLPFPDLLRIFLPSSISGLHLRPIRSCFSQDIRDQLNAEAEVVQIILTRIDNDIYSTIDACPNACEMFVTLVKQSQELKTVSYCKLYDILKQHQNEVNEIRAERLAHTANPLALVAQQQPIYHPQNYPNHNNQYSSNRSQQPTRNRGKAIVNSFAPIYDQEPATVTEDDEMSKEKEIDKLMALISLLSLGFSVITARNMGIYQGNVKKPKQKRMLLIKGKDFIEVTPDLVDNSGPIFDAEPLHKEQGDNNITIDSLDICYDREQDDQDDTDELDYERNLLASLIEKLKCEIDDSKNHNKFLKSSNKALVNKLKDLKKFQAELNKYHDVNYASKVAIDCAKAKGDLKSYKIESEKSSNEYTRKINDLNQTISDMKNELFAHQETIFIMSQEKEAQIKLYKTREDKELDKVIDLENKVKVLDDIVYKTGQFVQTINMLNRNCKMSFAKPEFLKKAQRANPRLYDIGCYNDNLALMLTPESDELIHFAKESRSKLSDLNRPFDYDQLNNLYDLFVPQQEKSPEQHYFPKTSKMSHTSSNNEISKESFHSLEKKDFSKSKSVIKYILSNDFSKPVTAQILPQNKKSILKNTNVIAPGMYKVHTEPNQTRTPQLPQDIRKTNKLVSFSTGVIPTTSISRPQLKSNQIGDSVMPNNSQGKIQEVEDHRTVKFGNDQIAPILGYGDLVQGTITIKRVITSKGLITIYSPSVNSVMRILKLLFQNLHVISVI
ncbi:hypothetical protein Tco_0363318 [Tanacetum coccineum]